MSRFRIQSIYAAAAMLVMATGCGGPGTSKPPATPVQAQPPKTEIVSSDKLPIKLVQPDTMLAKIVGDKPLSRPELTKKLWLYIKEHNLQDADKHTIVHADEVLLPLFNGQEQVNLLELTKLTSAHISEVK